jgi:hypothetical protein
MFLRSQIQLYFTTLYQTLLDIGISVEILFGSSLLVYCADFLNVEVYFRVVDMAFG